MLPVVLRPRLLAEVSGPLCVGSCIFLGFSYFSISASGPGIVNYNQAFQAGSHSFPWAFMVWCSLCKPTTPSWLTLTPSTHQSLKEGLQASLSFPAELSAALWARKLPCTPHYHP